MSTQARPGPATTVSLRPVTEADLPELFRIQLDPDANRMAAVVPRDAAAFEAIWRKIFSDAAVTARAIIADDVLCGSISCFKVDGLDHVGYWIDRGHWGRGIASRALELLIREVPARPLHASAARHNTASLKVLGKCGFELVEFRHSPGTERYLPCEEARLILR